MERGTGLLLVNCSGIHTCFMRFTIDAVYLDKQQKVLAWESISPWKMGRRIKGAKHVLEVPQGEGKELKVGKMVRLTEEKEPAERRMRDGKERERRR